jgi:hypothetical protein
MSWGRFSLEVFDVDKIFMKTLLSHSDFAKVLIEPLQQLLDREIPTIYTSSTNYSMPQKPESTNRVRKICFKV